MDQTKVIYLGSLDVYSFQLGQDNYFELPRGVATPLPTHMASRVLRPRPREFFREGEEIPAKVRAELDAQYASYPDRVIADMRKLGAKYQQIADTCDHENETKKRAMIDGAMDTVNACARSIFEHQNMKRRRAGEPELDWEAPETGEHDASGNDDANDFGEKAKPRRQSRVAI